MDFVNKAFAQASDLFRSMTPAARITTGLLLAAVVISVGYLFNHQNAAPDVGRRRDGNDARCAFCTDQRATNKYSKGQDAAR